MLSAGIDAGVAYTKVVILKDGAVAGKGTGPTGGVDRRERIEEVYHEALRDAGLSAGEVEHIAVTGKGKFDAGFAHKRVSEQLAAGKAAGHVYPDTTCVVSAGADETMVSVIEEGGRIGEYAFNQKCTAGLGLFLEYMADRLGMSLAELGSLDVAMGGAGGAAGDAPCEAAGDAACEAAGDAPCEAVGDAACEAAGRAAVNEGCVVFAELDALSLLNHGVAPAEVGKAVVYAAAARVSSVINDITKPSAAHVTLLGGLAKNAAFVKALEALTGLTFAIPADAEYAGALGAALTAAGSA
jgi:activator of 2-hydroxyglutaryl-CoA dehydratase